MLKVQMVVDGQVARVYVPYDLKDLVKALPERQWLKDLKAWAVPTSYVDGLADGLRAAGATVYVTTPNGLPWSGGGRRHGFGDTPALGWADVLFRAVGPAHHDAVYRALSKALHP